MNVKVEVGECSNCHEPISSWVYVSGNPWCSVCSASALTCIICHELFDDAYAINEFAVCGNDLLTFALGERLNPAKKLSRILP